MVDKSAAIATVLTKVKSLAVGHSLTLKTYKRDRSVTIVKQDTDAFLVRQQGFEQEEFGVAGTKLGRLLKRLLKKEFPRSNKIHLSMHGPEQEK